ncbi:uncharacterized protein LOC128921572 isoform X1 [Zeugodacus cucurbitae]|uniref:uncharacterized protein LOC128921572 isoform X1 n=1 Tax=Zeugodacus cucurbitae TaxID=28588 RepID=UPI0023D911A2|nr:uncharacterized protein LOC128921572 isoform X1 [Zeugodacus cucurbitae]
MDRKISALTGCPAVMETHIKLLLFLKISLIVWIVIIPAQRISLMSNIFAFPVFELAYIANYAIIRKLLILHKVLKKWIKHQEDQYRVKSQCTSECRMMNKPMRKAISLWGQSGQMLKNYLKYFNWYEKLVLMENIYCVYLANSLNHIINMLLIGMVNDTLKHEEDSLNDILMVLVAKLSQQARLCSNCRKLLKAVSGLLVYLENQFKYFSLFTQIDYHLCCRNLCPNGIYIFRNYWTRGFVIDVIQNLMILGFNITQFGSDVVYVCNYDPETTDILLFS